MPHCRSRRRSQTAPPPTYKIDLQYYLIVRHGVQVALGFLSWLPVMYFMPDWR